MSFPVEAAAAARRPRREPSEADGVPEARSTPGRPTGARSSAADRTASRTIDAPRLRCRVSASPRRTTRADRSGPPGAAAVPGSRAPAWPRPPLGRRATDVCASCVGRAAVRRRRVEQREHRALDRRGEARSTVSPGSNGQLLTRVGAAREQELHHLALALAGSAKVSRQQHALQRHPRPSARRGSAAPRWRAAAARRTTIRARPSGCVRKRFLEAARQAAVVVVERRLRRVARDLRARGRSARRACRDRAPRAG